MALSVIQPVNPDLVKLYCVHEEKTDEVDQNLEVSHTKQPNAASSLVWILI